GMGDRRRETRVGRAMLESLVDAADGLVGMDEIMMGRGGIGHEPKDRVIERYRRRAAALTPTGGVGLLGVAAKEPELRVVEVRGERVVDGLLVAEKPARILDVVDGGELLLPDVDASAFTLGDAGGKRLRLLERLPGRIGV